MKIPRTDGRSKRRTSSKSRDYQEGGRGTSWRHARMTSEHISSDRGETGRTEHKKPNFQNTISAKHLKYRRRGLAVDGISANLPKCSFTSFWPNDNPQSAPTIHKLEGWRMANGEWHSPFLHSMTSQYASPDFVDLASGDARTPTRLRRLLAGRMGNHYVMIGKE